MAWKNLTEDLAEMFAECVPEDAFGAPLEQFVAVRRDYFRRAQEKWRALNPAGVARQNAARAADPVRREKNKLAMRARRAAGKRR